MDVIDGVISPDGLSRRVCRFTPGACSRKLRTLVVFCLPGALGLPLQGEEDGMMGRVMGSQKDIAAGELPSKDTSKKSILSDLTGETSGLDSLTLESESLTTIIKRTPSDLQALLRKLPDPDRTLLERMKAFYPIQFVTLPVQVRSPHCWRLFVRFCFFSGLPIAEGELYYKMKDEVSFGWNADIYGEEVILSHEVMEAVNGEQSAEILRLPNKKTFAYLKRHYGQQSGKLDEEVFDRKCWEAVLPEV